MSVWYPEQSLSSYATLTRSCRHDWDGWLEGTDKEREAEYKRLRQTPCDDCQKAAADYVAPRVAA